ncbi:hypothetical protein SBRCBS47491_010025 [Sporothrix bragantina]|uniref:2-oxoadipate dioxygenase/decarboxylase n=1 Tax=Sporothrix bragantina TaxID=671064 RepID=A0ABP0D1A0_9PEZI
MGMHPVGYYDLRVADLPLHATAFRPLTEESLRKNPFRVFTSVLRRDLLSPDIRQSVATILQKRNLFTPRLLEILDQAASGQILTPQDADDLIVEGLKIFQWHSQTEVLIEDYLKLKQEHIMVADIVCFPSAHINHLTPRTLDIDLVQKAMIQHGLPAKERIEGPPPRQCPILLRQTSFKALEESVYFRSRADAVPISGTHTARFGEVEQRGAAVTPKGRALYDRQLLVATEKDKSTPGGLAEFESVLADAFSSYPDTWQELREAGLVYFRYRVTAKGLQYASKSDAAALFQDRVTVDRLLSHGLIDYEPITYEDFLPFSAAGIFQSNLAGNATPLSKKAVKGSLEELEEALGCKILDEFGLYERLQQESIQSCADVLHLDEIVLV